MKSYDYDKSGESKKQGSQVGFHLVLQVLNHLNQAAHGAMKFVSDGISKVKEFARPSTPTPPDEELNNQEISDQESEESEETESCRPSPKSVYSRFRNYKKDLSSSEHGKRIDRPRARNRSKIKGPHHSSRRHVSRGRGARFTSLRVLLLFCVVCCCVVDKAEAGNGGIQPRSGPSEALMLLPIVLFTCALLTLKAAYEKKSTASQPVFHRPRHSSCGATSSTFVYNGQNGRPSLHLLPNSHHVCSLADDSDTNSSAGRTNGISTIEVVTYPDLDSSSYVADPRFNPPESPFHSYVLLPDPRSSRIPPITATGEGLSPEVEVRNQQTLPSELVVGVTGQKDSRKDAPKTQKPGKLGLARTVSFQSEYSDLRSFNADTLDGSFGGEIVSDDCLLPLGGGRSQCDDELTLDHQEDAREEQLPYRVFAESASDLVLTDDEDYQDDLI